MADDWTTVAPLAKVAPKPTARHVGAPGSKRTRPTGSAPDATPTSPSNVQSTLSAKAEAPAGAPPARWRQAASQIATGGAPPVVVVRDVPPMVERPPSPLEAVHQELMASAQAPLAAPPGDDAAKQAAQPASAPTPKLAPWAKNSAKSVAVVAPASGEATRDASPAPAPAPVPAPAPAAPPKVVVVDAPKLVIPVPARAPAPADKGDPAVLTAPEGNGSPHAPKPPAATAVAPSPAPPVAAAPRVAGISYKSVAARSAGAGATDKGDLVGAASHAHSSRAGSGEQQQQHPHHGAVQGGGGDAGGGGGARHAAASPSAPDYSQGGLGLGLGSSGALSTDLGLALQGLRLSASPGDASSAFTGMGSGDPAVAVDAAQAGLLSSMMSMMGGAGNGMSPDGSPAGGVARKPLRLRVAAPEFVPSSAE